MESRKMPLIQRVIAVFSCFVLALALTACGGGNEAGPRGGQGPKPRQDDPKLDHSWEMPKESSAESVQHLLLANAS